VNNIYLVYTWYKPISIQYISMQQSFTKHWGNIQKYVITFITIYTWHYTSKMHAGSIFNETAICNNSVDTKTAKHQLHTNFMSLGPRTVCLNRIFKSLLCSTIIACTTALLKCHRPFTQRSSGSLLTTKSKIGVISVLFYYEFHI